MRARIRRRYRSERLFRLVGLAALVLAASFLAFLLFTIGRNGLTGFERTEVKVTVAFDPAVLNLRPEQLTGPGAEAALGAADFQTVLANGVTNSLGPDGEGMISEGAWLTLRDMLAKRPDLLGMQADVWVPATSVVDQLAKGRLDRAGRTVSADLLLRYDSLERRKLLRTGWNTAFLSVADSTDPELAGVWGALKGSLLTLAVTLSICFPVGVLAAIYLEEYAPRNRWTDIIEVSINNLAAVPSIIFGLLGLAVFLNFMNLPRSAPIVGGLTLALMTMPVIVIAGRVAIKAVPPSIRDGALAVGASPVQVVFHHVLPLALPGILTGTIIGMSRALGETAPLLLIGMRAFVADVPAGVTQPATVLPVQIYLWSDEVARGFVEKTSAAIIVLLMVLLLMNGLAIYLRNKFERRW
ncbi:MAG: phosphate ABC transporter permease PstA [Alphaproteobacteria bacterium]|nr:phosphate ABC transporter permease PstA [Alphaproteobacteria bacterium]MCA3571327.1 phosphate ABC transporter permease PstA [Bradyrhizobium sp.]